ncbi:metalloendopeptidase OMA1, putative [Pediculus humanus corporis]|uniref:Metalloendopeptidase OMA1, mitochondrial n=1 Tax=Pediculus humanus subsp. corporis TaxID=121224 RepID=E0VKN7_PEDHC|nr:metalloendopeptidase OMA1, putative [Pediculus humanus corporis]EEB13943.1 metalloendopeptidase OMA1, putative [Pediculus humanus corporis]
MAEFISFYVIKTIKKAPKKIPLFNPNKIYFHTSNPRNAIPPILVLALRSIVKLGPVISGRIIRRWWQKLPQEEKEKILQQIYSKKTKIACCGTIFIGALYLYYLENITEEPLTKRKRFMVLNQKQLYQIAEFEYNQQMRTYKQNIVPAWHPLYRRVTRVANNLLLSNRDLKEIRDKTWTVIVVDRPDITNAFALPHGKIFVFTGMLNLCTNDHQLAIVLAHEISHSILSHTAESMSKIFLMEFILIIPSLIFWSILSDAWALFSEWITANIASVLIHLPFSRAIEKEADFVGLQLAAKSCYDIREAPIFWGKLKVLSSDAVLEWLSTHPRHESRQSELKELLPQALELREKSNCPPLVSNIHYFPWAM